MKNKKKVNNWVFTLADENFFRISELSKITFSYTYSTACLGDGIAIEIPDGGDQSGVIASPGCPYIVPEHSECRWIVKAPEGKVCKCRFSIHRNRLTTYKYGLKMFSFFNFESNSEQGHDIRDRSSLGQLSMRLWVSRNFRRRGRKCHFFQKVCTVK